jgi:hypothetical protein
MPPIPEALLGQKMRMCIDPDQVHKPHGNFRRSFGGAKLKSLREGFIEEKLYAEPLHQLWLI